ncbi:MAG: hypothetical protein NZM43_13690 [Saprospiraceae bacterium]|nr:hypothetical protein [Saprospiraceae bacterium]MDW8485367.1 hypothetical protein [Saprospiraceae bacterium]
MKIQKITPIYSAAGERTLAKQLNAETLFRAPFGANSSRFYFLKDFPDFLSGYSHWTSCVLPKSPHLIKWMTDMGDEGERIALETRTYGSVLHYVIAESERADGQPFRFEGEASKWWRDAVRMYMEAHGIGLHLYDTWCANVQNDMFAWQSFKRDCDVQVLAVEFPVHSKEYRIGTPADVIALVQTKEGRKLAAIDIKATTRDVSASRDYQLQLHFIRWAFNQAHGETMQIERTYNWSLMDRAKSPGRYRLKEQVFASPIEGKRTGALTEELFFLYMRLNVLEGYYRPSGEIVTFEDGPDGQAIMLVQKPGEWLKQWQKGGKI